MQTIVKFFLFGILLSGCLACNQENTEPTFIKFLGTPFDDRAFGVDSTADGGFVLVGTTKNQTSQEIYWAKINAKGNKEHTKTIALSAINLEGRDIITLSNQHSLVLGLKHTHTNKGRFWLLELDEAGTLIDSMTIGNVDLNTSGDAYLLKADNDNFYLVGNTAETNSKSDLYLMKINADREVLLERAYGIIDRQDSTANLIVAPDNPADLIWAGTSERKAGKSDLRVIRADAFGNLKWDFAFDDQDEISQTGAQVQAASGALVSIGTITDGGQSKIYVVNLQPDGSTNTAPLIIESLALPSADITGQCVLPIDGGGYIIAGSIEEADNTKIYLAQIAATGNILWEQSFGNPQKPDNNTANDLERAMRILPIRENGVLKGYLLLTRVWYGNNYVIGMIRTDTQGRVYN